MRGPNSGPAGQARGRPLFKTLNFLGKKSGRSYPRNQTCAAISGLGGVHFFPGAIAIGICVCRTIPAVHRMLELPSAAASRTRDGSGANLSPAVCNNRNRRRVSTTCIARLNYWVIARDTCCAAKTPSKSASARNRRSRLRAHIEQCAICDLIWTGYDAHKGDELSAELAQRTGRAATLKGGVKCELRARL